jgi:DNA polymerase-4
MPDPIHFADHTLTRSVTELFDKLYQRRMRPSIGIRFSGWFAERTKSICLKIRNAIALSGDGSNEKRYGFDAVARCAGATSK